MAIAIPNPQQRRWDEYLAAESGGAREEKLLALDQFIEELLQLPEEAWKRWALALSADIVDHNQSVPVRGALFERVLFPALADGMDARSPGCARWLAGFPQHLYHCAACRARLGTEGSSTWALLHAAVAQDPDDQGARRRLIKLTANHLDYTLHELPAGVLYGVDGATIAQCDKLLAELDEFRSLIAIEGRATEYAELVADCDLHFNAYKQYLLERPSQQSYSQYLEQRGGDPAGG
jgi:hypothetical protein